VDNGARAPNNNLGRSGSQRSMTRDNKIRFGGLADASFNILGLSSVYGLNLKFAVEKIL